MCCCAIECVQCCVYFFNILFMITGIALLISGVVLLINGFVGFLSVLVPSLPYFYVAIILIIAAVLILCISIYGCMAAFKGDVCALIWYYILVVIVLCLEASALIMTFVVWRSGGYHSQIQDYVAHRVQLTMGRYGDGGDSAITEAWDDLQKNKECCGVENNLDWYKFAEFEPGRPPDSCCVEFYEGCSKAVNGAVVWEEGCKQYLIDATFSGLSALGSIVIIFIIIQIILLLFVLILIFLKKFGNDPKNTCCGTYVLAEDKE
ncbi:Tetraspanin-4 [Holothuria leucospilota]|uniref:Tetraspanin n=1 Tax=Holothuria leucospilota TaxID=206669 RepID=A0A9Q0YLF4_HOLLE|nr:Tetraspanin-4 [Holothuria leucospilota]